MHRWGEADRADDVAAVVSELLANALRHALSQAGEDAPPWPIRLGLLHAGLYVVCAVADPGAGIPVLTEPDYLGESGRGLLVVASLSDQWGYCPAPESQERGGEEGKVVWAAFAATNLF
jgi:anti-sigma regulatory factor (Ser/Thr protein kinase)